ncbi:MAG: hypothetical protein IT432_05275 [Phycisphaerales bacterium]|nr:hypothetical protein [Phycisphaerales bacterium]
MKAVCVGVMALFATPLASAQNILFNGDFEEPAYLNTGQSLVGVGEQKTLVRDNWLAGYDAGIFGIMDWINSWSDVGFGEGARDAGLSRVDYAGSGESQYAFINNWETRLSQVTSHTIAAGEVFNAGISIGPRGENQGGRVQLWAGIPSYANPDVFDPSAILLGEVTVATGDWTAFTPDLVLDLDSWNLASLSVTIPDGSSAIGLPLTMSFLTSGGSWGPLNFDTASLEVVPSSGTWVLAAIAGFFVFRRSR